MSKVFRLSSPAQHDIDDIWSFIAEHNETAANDVLDGILEACLTLAQFPGAGRRRPEWGSDVRAYPVGNLLVVYRHRIDVVEIVRVIHGARDPERWLKE